MMPLTLLTPVALLGTRLARQSRRGAAAFAPPLDPLPVLASWRERDAMLAACIRQRARPDRPLAILEAGCGLHWGLDLDGVAYTLTGLDVDAAALAYRAHRVRDLDMAVRGDLRTVALAAETYDVIYCSYVLEHIDDAQHVLTQFVRWLRPGGLLLIAVPDRESAFGFLARLTPFWLHVLYKRHVQGYRQAGQPGHAPFRTWYHPVIARRGLHAFCTAHGLTIATEYGMGGYLQSLGRGYRAPVWLLLHGLHRVSGGRLAARYNDLVMVIEKPAHSPESPAEHRPTDPRGHDVAH